MSDEQSSSLEHDEFCVSLNFWGDDIEPSEITRLIGCEPTSAARTGDPNTRLSIRAGRSFTYPLGFWSLSTQRSTRDIEEQIAELFSRLTSDYDVWCSPTTRYDADLFCGVFLSWFCHGFSMSPALHRAVTDRNLLITFDIYPEYDRNAYCVERTGGSLDALLDCRVCTRCLLSLTQALGNVTPHVAREFRQRSACPHHATCPTMPS